MTHRRTLRAVALVLFAVGAGLLMPSSGHAATIESGWWSRLNIGTTLNQSPAPPIGLPTPAPAVPAPPNAEGGLQVAALPDGALSIAAVRVDAELTSLTLRVAPNGDANGMSAKLAACKAMTAWEPVSNGPWDAKPVVACDLINGGGSVAGIPAPDGSSWTFPVGPLSDDGKTDVVIVPLADSEVVQGFAAPFQLVFVPPTGDDVVVAPTTAEDSSPDPTDGTDEETRDFADESTGFSSFDPTFASGSGASSAPVVSPALGAADQAPVLPRFVPRTESDDASQLLGAAIVLLALGLFYLASRQATPPITPLVGSGVGREIPAVKPQVGGLGRFARPRVGTPPSLQ